MARVQPLATGEQRVVPETRAQGEASMGGPDKDAVEGVCPNPLST